LQKKVHLDANRISYKYFESYNIEYIITKRKYSSEVLDFIKSKHPDALFRCGWGIIKEPLLSITPTGILSYHHGNIRKYRGHPPAFWQFLNKEKSVGVTIQILEDGIDCGAIVKETQIPIYAIDTYESLNRRVYTMTYSLIVEACQLMDSNNFIPKKLSPDELGPIYSLPKFYQLINFILLNYS